MFRKANKCLRMRTVVIRHWKVHEHVNNCGDAVKPKSIGCVYACTHACTYACSVRMSVWLYCDCVSAQACVYLRQFHPPKHAVSPQTLNPNFERWRLSTLGLQRVSEGVDETIPGAPGASVGSGLLLLLLLLLLYYYYYYCYYCYYYYS